MFPTAPALPSNTAAGADDDPHEKSAWETSWDAAGWLVLQQLPVERDVVRSEGSMTERSFVMCLTEREPEPLAVASGLK